MNKLNSKRFYIMVISIVIFCIGVFITKVEPVKMAESIGLLLSPYLLAESYKPTKNI